jgi:O-antigen/teichoic acid export membrane protein
LFKHILHLARWFHLGTTAILLISALVSAATFVLLARGLGVNNFGLLMIMQALSQLAADLVALGAGDMLVRRVSRDLEQHRSALGHALIMTVVTSIPLAVALSVLAVFFYPPIGTITIGTFMVGELSGNGLVSLAECSFIGHSLINGANIIRLASVTSKLALAIVTIYVLHVTSLANWMVIQGVGTLLMGIICTGYVIIRFGMPIPIFQWSELRRGTLLAIGQTAGSVQYNMDRIMLGLVAAPSIVAVYSAANRVILAALIPVMGIMRNLYAGFFNAGAEGILAARRHAFTNLPKVVLVAAATMIGLVLAADIVAALLGRGFEDTAHILRWLSAIPLLRGIQLLLADTLTGSDHQLWRTSIGLVGAVGYIIAITICTSLYGVNGLIVAVNFYNFVMIFAYLIAVRALASRQHFQPI